MDMVTAGAPIWQSIACCRYSTMGMPAVAVATYVREIQCSVCARYMSPRKDSAEPTLAHFARCHYAAGGVCTGAALRYQLTFHDSLLETGCLSLKSHTCVHTIGLITSPSYDKTTTHARRCYCTPRISRVKIAYRNNLQKWSGNSLLPLALLPSILFANPSSHTRRRRAEHMCRGVMRLHALCRETSRAAKRHVLQALNATGPFMKQ